VLAASGYAPAQRGLSWLKLKRDYLEGLADSLDLVPIGAWWGQGRKVRKGDWFSSCGLNKQRHPDLVLVACT